MTDKQPDAHLTANAFYGHVISDDELRQLHDENERLKAERDELLGLLNEVRMNFTCDDDLPDDLLPRIDAAIAKAKGRACA